MCSARSSRPASTATPRTDLGGGRRVLVEFVSANPTGPLHAGHGRGAAYGDSLARVLERTGHLVSRENYLNDRGTQMQLFVASLAARRRGEQPPEGGYQGQYIIDWAAEIPEGADLLEWGEARAVEDHRETLERMNVHFDTWFSERSMVGIGRHRDDAGRPARPGRGRRPRRRGVVALHRLR